MSTPLQTASSINKSPLQRVWRYGPVVLWMALIFYFSTNEFSANNTSAILRPLLLWLMPGLSDAQLAIAHFVVRKAAHLTAYAVLASLASRAFLSSRNRFLFTYWAPLALLISGVYALVDEYHQSFVPSRTPSLGDCAIDVVGAALALLLIAVLRRRSSNYARRFQSAN